MAEQQNGNGISRSSLTIIITCAGLIYTVTSGFLGWQNAATQQSFTELKTAVEKLRDGIATGAVAAGERQQQIKALQEVTARHERILDEFTKIAPSRGQKIDGLSDEVKRLDGDLRSTRREIVSREEHKEKAEKEKVVLEGIIERLGRLERELGGTYSLRDAIKALQDWRDRTEARNGVPRS